MILPILHYPDKRLRTVAQPVLTVDKAIQTLVKNMFETMYSEDGIGLAATQINQHIQVVVSISSKGILCVQCRVLAISI